MASEPSPLAAELASIRERAKEMRNREVWVRLAAAEADRDRLLGAAEAVLERHQPDGHGACTGCREECLYCESDHEWPCPTVRAITSKLIAEGETDGT